MTDDDKLHAAVEGMFGDHRFKRVSNSIWLYAAVIDSVRVGVIEATYNSNYGNFTLNCNEFKRVIDAKSSGRAGAVYVVKSRYNAATYKKLVVEAIEATALGEMLRSAEPREGKHGPFWTLGGSDAEDWM